MSLDAAQLKAFALEQVDLVGVASADAFADAPPGTRPVDILPECRSVVAFAVKHLDVFTLTTDLDSQAYSQDLTNHETFHQAYRLARYLEKHGCMAFPMVASVQMWPRAGKGADVAGRISLRHAAQLAGLGRIGRSGLLLTPQFGPRTQLGAVLTDAELDADEALGDTPCTMCARCTVACPPHAIDAEGWPDAPSRIDHELCMQFRRAKGGASPLGFEHQCSLCRAVCPVGRPKGYTVGEGR